MNIIEVSNVHGYVDKSDKAWLNAEDVARGFGFTTVAKSGNDVVRWARVNEYLQSFGYPTIVGKDDYLPENMVYRLGFKASNEAAMKFQAVLADEVLPSIRKTGGYIAFNQDMTDEEIMARAIMVAQSTIKKREEEIRLLAEQNNQLALENQQLKKDHDYFDKILSSKATMTTTQIAQDYGMSAKAFNKILKDLHIQYKINKQWILYAPYITQGYVQSRTIEITRSNGTPDVVLNTAWTQKGRIFLYNKLKENNIIPLIEQ